MSGRSWWAAVWIEPSRLSLGPGGCAGIVLVRRSPKGVKHPGESHARPGVWRRRGPKKRCSRGSQSKVVERGITCEVRRGLVERGQVVIGVLQIESRITIWRKRRVSGGDEWRIMRVME